MPSAAVLAGLQGNPVSVIPKQYLPVRIKPMRGKRAPAFAMKGIYVSALFGSHLYGFPKNNSANADPLCSVPALGVQGFGVDNSGNLIVPQAFSGIYVVEGPTMCGGTVLGTITDPFGEPVDASAVNAATGNIVVANLFDTAGGPGSASVCTLASGTCSINLTNPGMHSVAGVAMDSAGDCWADGINSSDAAVLVYFAGCTGSGQVTTGFTNVFYGGVDIDSQGNLVTTSLFGPFARLPSTVNVYSGCKPACTLLSSTFLIGLSAYGHIGKQNARYVTTDLEFGDVEVYMYKKTGLSPYYSFTGGLPCVLVLCEAAAYDPSSPK
ncbi:MAG: hypothetical protein WAK16_02620 [Candidatus Cybelea sp.]